MAKVRWVKPKPGEPFFGGRGVLIPFRPSPTASSKNSSSEPSEASYNPEEDAQAWEKDARAWEKIGEKISRSFYELHLKKEEEMKKKEK